MAYIRVDTPRATDTIWTGFTELAGDVRRGMRYLLANRAAYAALQKLSDRGLKDIGMTRDDAMSLLHSPDAAASFGTIRNERSSNW